MSENDMLTEVFEYLAEFFEGDAEKALWWMFTQNLNFGDIKPYELVATGRTKRVWEFVRSARQGNEL